MSSNQERPINVFGIGNALVDILALVPDDFIQNHQLDKGIMTLVDDNRQGNLIENLGNIPLKMRSGGSAANSMIAIALSGGNGYFTGKVAADPHGDFYRQDLINNGINFDVKPGSPAEGRTGTCLVLTTPDAERTLCTNLGISTQLSATDINVDNLRRCQYSYVEGYLWTSPAPRQACIETMEYSKKHDVKIAFTFSDAFLVESFADDYHNLMKNYADVVFCNSLEAQHFFQTESLTECATKLGELVDLAFITDGPNGCLLVENRQIIQVPGFPVKAIDTVGAGDAFAGGALYGLTNGLTPVKSARWGNYLGSLIVQIYGPRLAENLADRITAILGH